MKTVNIHEAKTHLSRLVEKAANGESFVIAKAGKPMVRVVALDAPSNGQRSRIGFLKGQITVPDDFDQMGREQIPAMFSASPPSSMLTLDYLRQEAAQSRREDFARYLNAVPDGPDDSDKT